MLARAAHVSDSSRCSRPSLTNSHLGSFTLIHLVGGKDYGVAKKTNILGVKVLDNAGAGYTSDIIAGIDHVVRAAINSGRNTVISMSVGGGGYSQAMDEAIENAFNNGVFVTGE